MNLKAHKNTTLRRLYTWNNDRKQISGWLGMEAWEWENSLDYKLTVWRQLPLRERRDTMQLEIGSQWGPSQKPERKLEPGSPGVPSGSYGGSCLTSQLTPTTPLHGVSPRWAPAWSLCLSGIYTAWRINSSGQEWLGRMSAAQWKGRGQNSEKCLGTSLNQLSSTWGTLCLGVQRDFPGTTTYGEF